MYQHDLDEKVWPHRPLLCCVILGLLRLTVVLQELDESLEQSTVFAVAQVRLFFYVLLF